MPLGDTPLPVPSNKRFNHLSLSIYYRLEKCLTWINFPLHTPYSCDPARGPGFLTSLFHIFPPACTFIFIPFPRFLQLHCCQPIYINKSHPPPKRYCGTLDPMGVSCSSEMSLLMKSRTLQSTLYNITQFIN